MQSDIEIAKNAKMLDIRNIAKEAGIDKEYLEFYGRYKAKISTNIFDKLNDRENGKLVLVTAVNPTPLGEGKTTVTVGLGQALKRIGKKAIIALREPSLGPVMGLKGGAAGGGYAQVVPMEDINLHFTGDIHAVTAANNLLSSVIDNHIYQGNELRIDSNRITWKRVMDINDRSLRQIVIGLGGITNGVTREDGFNISVASEVMAILCLSNNLSELKYRLSKIIIGYNFDNEPVYVKDLKAENAMAVLLKDAIKPNIVQTLENTPVIIHGGPFANIAHGCNSVIATRLGLKLADYCITEAGFGADLGAEKFFDIKCQSANLKPDVVVIVATIRALKYNGGMDKNNLGKDDVEFLKKGFCNLEKHIENMKRFAVPVSIALNRFSEDTKEEVDFVKSKCKELGVRMDVVEVFEKGGEGGIDLANTVVELAQNEKSQFKPLYDTNLSIKNKIGKVAKEIYGASGIVYTNKANSQISKIEKLNLGNLPICIAKTQYSLSDNPKLLGRPSNFELNVREVTISNGAGFIVVITGDILTMPGLPKNPALEKVDIDENGEVYGLF